MREKFVLSCKILCALCIFAAALTAATGKDHPRFKKNVIGPPVYVHSEPRDKAEISEPELFRPVGGMIAEAIANVTGCFVRVVKYESSVESTGRLEIRIVMEATEQWAQE